MKTRVVVLTFASAAVIVSVVGYNLHRLDLLYLSTALALLGSAVGVFVPRTESQKARIETEMGSKTTPSAEKTSPAEVAPGDYLQRSESEEVNWEGISDPVTGMLNDLFFAGLIGTKVATARRRLWPVSIALLHVTFGSQVTDKAEENQASKEFADTIMATIRDADVACRLSRKTFALLLDDTDEDGAAWASERIQLAQARKGDSLIAKVSAGVASYPSHGIEPTEILTKAREALEKAVNNADLPGLGLVIVAPQRPL